MGIKRHMSPCPIAGVYKWTCLADGMFYIGSSVDCEKRMAGHRNLLRKKTHTSRCFQNAWSEHGEGNFRFEIIERTAPIKSEVLAAEQKYLDELRPFDPSVGYNISPTACSPLGVRHTEENNRNNSLRLTGRKLSEEHKKNIGKASALRRPTQSQLLNRSLLRTDFQGEKLKELLRLRSLGMSSRQLARHFDTTKISIMRTLKGKQLANGDISDPLPKSAWTPKLTLEDAACVKRLYFEGVKKRHIAIHFGVPPAIVWRIVNDRTYKSANLEFSTKEYY